MTKDAADLLDLVIKRTPKLRELGIKTLAVSPDGGLSLELGELPPGLPGAVVETIDDDGGDPLTDLATFGLSKTSKLPSRGKQ